MLERIELTDQDRRLARRMWRELHTQTTLEQCEDAVQIVKECRHHGIDPSSILGPGMETFMELEKAEAAVDKDATPGRRL